MHVDPRPLRDLLPMPKDDLRRTLASVAAAVAERHGQSRSTGELSLDTVLIAPSGDVVLSGDEARVSDIPRELDALRALISAAIDGPPRGASDPWGMLREQLRDQPRFRRAMAERGERRLRSIAKDQSIASAAALAWELNKSRQRAGLRTRPALIAGGATTALVALAAVVVIPRQMSGGSVEPRLASEITTTTTAESVAQRQTTRLWPACPGSEGGGTPPSTDGDASAGTEGATDARTALDIDGDGCEDTIEIAEGVVRSRDGRWKVGTALDSVTVGDIDCSGHAKVALLRVSNGDVFVFDGWAKEGEPLAGRWVGRIAQADHLATVPAGICGRIHVVTQDGTTEIMATAP